jgi:hypothetical protein
VVDTIAKRWNQARGLRVQVAMSATKRRVRFVPGAIMTCVASLAVAACGIAGPAGSGRATDPSPAHVVQPGSPLKVTISREPRPGGFAAGRAAPSPHRKITADSSGRLRLTASDNGATVVIKPGQIILVVLDGNGQPRWNPIQLTGLAPDVLRLLGRRGGYPSAAPARASYRARRPGTTEIVSATDAPCLHAHPRCQIVQLLWRVTVVVH